MRVLASYLLLLPCHISECIDGSYVAVCVQLTVQYLCSTSTSNLASIHLLNFARIHKTPLNGRGDSSAYCACAYLVHSNTMSLVTFLLLLGWCSLSESML